MAVPDSSSSTWHRSALLVVASFFPAVVLSYLWIGTYGSWRLLEGSYPFAIYDQLGGSLLAWHVAVPSNHESFFFNGKYFVYFGPLPAFLRIPFNFLFPGVFGEWDRVSCLIAGLIAWLAFATLAWAAIGRRQDLPERRKTIILAALLAAFAWGSPLFFLLTYPSIYHEAALWGLAFSLVGLTCVFALEAGPNEKMMWGLSVSAGLALLSRVTSGSSLVLLLLPINIRALQHVRWPKVALFSLPVIAALSFQLWYNDARFGWPFTFADLRYYVNFQNSPVHLTLIDRVGTQDFRRIPDTLSNYFGFSPSHFHADWPWLRFAPPSYRDQALFDPYREWVLSLWEASPWIVAAALAGLLTVARRRGDRRRLLSLIAFVPQTLVALTFYYVTYRYTADYLPLASFLLFSWISTPGTLSSRPVRVLLFTLCAYSIVATVSSSLHHQAVVGYTPAEDKARLQRLLHLDPG